LGFSLSAFLFDAMAGRSGSRVVRVGYTQDDALAHAQEVDPLLAVLMAVVDPLSQKDPCTPPPLAESLRRLQAGPARIGAMPT
jgi:hypothetical protein